MKKKLFPFHGSINLCEQFLRIRNEVDVLLCYASDHFPLPFLARLLGKKAILFKGGLTLDELSSRAQLVNCRANSESSVTVVRRTIARLVRRLSYLAFDRIVLVSSDLAKDPDLRKAGVKLEVARFFPDSCFFEDFFVKKELGERDTIVGYVGRLEQIKGIEEFVKAIPLVLSQRKDVRFLIVGDGDLRAEMESELTLSREKNVEVMGNVPRSEIPDLLNKLKLIVLPSFYEGLPTVVIEAMACGTPVLATNVGAVSDLIIKEDTGFILNSNSPECIANSILRILTDPKIHDISRNARAFVTDNYDYASAVSGWKNVFGSLG